MTNLIIILAEISLIIIIFLSLTWLVDNLSKLLIKFSVIKLEERRSKILRRNITQLLLIACSILCILIVGANSFLLYQGQDIQKYTLGLINHIPSGF